MEFHFESWPPNEKRIRKTGGICASKTPAFTGTLRSPLGLGGCFQKTEAKVASTKVEGTCKFYWAICESLVFHFFGREICKNIVSLIS